LARSLF